MRVRIQFGDGSRPRIFEDLPPEEGKRFVDDLLRVDASRFVTAPRELGSHVRDGDALHINRERITTIEVDA